MSELKVHIELTRFVQPEKVEIDANERAVNEKSPYCFFVCTTFDSFLNDLYNLVCRKIFCFWVKSILGNYETTLHSYFLPGDIDWYGYRWTDVHCFSIVDCRWDYSIGDVTFIMDQKEKTNGI